jgi:hypothetical protein
MIKVDAVGLLALYVFDLIECFCVSTITHQAKGDFWFKLFHGWFFWLFGVERPPR